MNDDFTALDTRREHDGYNTLLSDIRREFSESIQNGEGLLFTTSATGLYDVLLEHLPEELRQYYTCSTCREFVRRYGGLVRIDRETGVQYPVMWGQNAPPLFADAVRAVRERVRKARVTGVFFTSKECLGKPVTGVWVHMSVNVPREMILKSRLHSAYQAAANAAENHRLLCESVEKYPIELAEEAVNLLRSDTLYRSGKVLGVGEWFLEVQRSIRNHPGNAYNILWQRSAAAPAGFCHISASMAGTLLDDLKAGLRLEQVSRRFAAKMHPLQYQRPQAAPGAGNVERAEKIVEEMGLANSLKRRFARLEELETVWKPLKPIRTGGIFADVEIKERRSLREPVMTMTWEKFRRTVLPTARRIQFRVSGRKESYSAIVTATDPSAPPILRWDTEKRRCPFNWYVYHNGSFPRNWNLREGYVDVTAIVLQPNMWHSGHKYVGKGVFFILKGAKDLTYKGAGLALFPEVLRSELYEVRSTIEAYSKKGTLSGAEEASACGLRLQGDLQWKDIAFRVTADVGTSVYELDRWD
ncbi:MAG: hypothetical protein K2O18_02325 [Oscillospiraceae bacterium]|nr:hypothetical protein [Oscillospiraceae bacterium]